MKWSTKGKYFYSKYNSPKGRVSECSDFKSSWKYSPTYCQNLEINAQLLFISIFVSSSRHWNFNDGCAFVKENKTIFTVSLLKLNKTVNFFSFKGTSSQSCAIAGCKKMCGTTTKCIKSLKGLYEIDDQWVHLHKMQQVSEDHPSLPLQPTFNWLTKWWNTC